MKKREMILSVAVAVVLVGLVLSAYFWVSTYREKTNEFRAEQWKQTFRLAVADLKEFAKKEGMPPEVSKMVKFFEKTAVRAIPRTNELDIFDFEIDKDRPIKPYKIGLVLLSQDDSRLSQLWKEEFDKKQYAFFHIEPGVENSSLLFVKKDFQISKIWKNLSLIKAITPAYLHKKGIHANIIDPNLKESYYKLNAYIVQDKILQNIGGEEYQNILNRETLRIEEEIGENVSVTIHYDLYRDELAKILGQPASEKEAEMRMETILIESILNFYDRNYSEKKALEHKLLFLEDVNNFLEAVKNNSTSDKVVL